MMNDLLNNFNGIFIITLGIVICISRVINRCTDENEEHSRWFTLVTNLLDWWILGAFVTIMFFRTKEYTLKKVAIVYALTGIVYLFAIYDTKYKFSEKIEREKAEVKKTKIYRFGKRVTAWFSGDSYDETEDAVKSNTVKRLYAFAECAGVSFMVDQEDGEEVTITIKNNTEDMIILDSEADTWLAELDYRHQRSVYSNNDLLRLRPMDEVSISISRRITVDHEDPVVYFPSVLRLNLAENKVEQNKVVFPIVSYDVDETAPLMMKNEMIAQQLRTINSETSGKQVDPTDTTMSYIRAILSGEKVVMKLDDREYDAREMRRMNLYKQADNLQNAYVTLYFPEFEKKENKEAEQEAWRLEIRPTI